MTKAKIILVIIGLLLIFFASITEAKNYTPEISPGDGVTHLARKALFQFIGEHGIAPNFTVGHLLFMEDYLAKNKKGLKVLWPGGYPLSFSQAELQEAQARAGALTQTQILDLNNWANAVRDYYDFSVGKRKFRFKQKSLFSGPIVEGLASSPDFAVSKDKIFLLSFESKEGLPAKFFIIDISRIESPSVIASLVLPSARAYHGIVFENENIVDIIVSEGGEDLLLRIDISQPNNPKIIEKTKSHITAEDLYKQEMAISNLISKSYRFPQFYSIGKGVLENGIAYILTRDLNLSQRAFLFVFEIKENITPKFLDLIDLGISGNIFDMEIANHNLFLMDMTKLGYINIYQIAKFIE